jgi:hypothetical protein
MPTRLSMVALMAEMTKLLYDTPHRSQWGDDLIQWTFSALANYEFSDELSAIFITQFRTRRNYETGDDDTFYQFRVLDEDNKRSLQFFRAALILSYKLR